MPDEFVIRRATPADAGVVARQRAAMFRDMGRVAPENVARLIADSEAFLRGALATGEYLGWLASPAGRPQAVAGAGVQVRRVLPFPQHAADSQGAIAEGRQAIVLNVYTEPEFRRRGLARRLLREVLDWARAARIESLVLHAAPDGRPLYEALGFVATNEMRFAGPLDGPPGPGTGEPARAGTPAT